MINTTPRQRAALLEAVPQIAQFAQPALRLHPRRGKPTATQSSAGGPLLWPDGEEWPTCTAEHRGGADSVDRPAILVAAVQLFKSDIGAGAKELPGWIFPEGADLLQILWCPNKHVPSLAPLARIVWRNSRDLAAASARKPELSRVDISAAVPVECLLHPEVVAELPPITVDEGGASDRDNWPGRAPEALEALLSEWRHPVDKPHWGDFSHCDALTTAPGWKLGGWAGYAGYPGRYATCSCGAPTRLIFDAMAAEGHGSWWTPIETPSFEWGAPRDWQHVEPTDVRVGRDGFLAFFGCTADPTHPLISYIE